MQPCRPLDERLHRKTLNTARRYLHLEREKVGLSAKAEEFGALVPIISGKYYPIAKACITWRGKLVASVQDGKIAWAEKKELESIFGADFRRFSADKFLKAWQEFLV